MDSRKSGAVALDVPEVGNHHGRQINESGLVVSSCGIDPGSDKFGLAVADGGGVSALIFSAILPTSESDLAVMCLADGNFNRLSRWFTEGSFSVEALRVECLYVGNGTGMDFFSRKLNEKKLVYNIIDESFTTMEGRRLYWKLHPPRGLWRLVPLSLRVPPRPVDDLAALVILERGMIGGASVTPLG
jgi:hypothetical protein